MLGAVDKGANVLDADNSSMDGVIATDTNVLLYAFGYEIGMDNNILDKNDSNNNYSKAYNNFITNVSKTGTILVYTYTNINEIRTVAQKMVAIRKGKELGWTKNTKILNDAGQVSTTPINFEETSKLYNLKNS